MKCSRVSASLCPKGLGGVKEWISKHLSQSKPDNYRPKFYPDTAQQQ